MRAEHTPAGMPQEALEVYLDLYSRHQRRLYLYINAMLPSPADADEVFQESNIVIWKKFDQFEPGSDFLAWAYRIAFLQVKDYCRRARRGALSFSPEVLEQLSSQVRATEPALEERRQALTECTKKLADDDRELVKRCYAPGAHVKQVARSLDREPTSVYRSLRRIRQLLLECIQQAVQAGA